MVVDGRLYSRESCSQLLHGRSLVLIDGLPCADVDAFSLGGIEVGFQLGSLLELLLHGGPLLLIGVIDVFGHELPIGAWGCRLDEVEARVALVAVPSQVHAGFHVVGNLVGIAHLGERPEAVGLVRVVHPDGTAVGGRESAFPSILSLYEVGQLVCAVAHRIDNLHPVALG